MAIDRDFVAGRMELAAQGNWCILFRQCSVFFMNHGSSINGVISIYLCYLDNQSHAIQCTVIFIISNYVSCILLYLNCDSCYVF